MQYLFDAAGTAALALAMASRPLLAFDFDGTLAPIVDHPGDARVGPPIAQRLYKISMACPVAVVTGRAVDDVVGRLGFTPHYVVGSHGAEDSASAVPPDPAALDAARTRIAAHAPQLHAAGVTVEDKRHSLALHYRRAPHQQRATHAIESLLTALPPGVQSFGGKDVVNLVAAAAPDKGAAIESLLGRSGCGWVVFIGDDLGDEPAFARAQHNWLTIRVGHAPSASLAAYYINQQDQMEQLLDCIIAQLPVQSAPSDPYRQ